jgi:hypothetical protein
MLVTPAALPIGEVEEIAHGFLPRPDTRSNLLRVAASLRDSLCQPTSPGLAVLKSFWKSLPPMETRFVKDLESRCGATWAAIQRASDKTAELLARVGGTLSKFESPEASVVVTGSVGRGEVTKGSDFDWRSSMRTTRSLLPSMTTPSGTR